MLMNPSFSNAPISNLLEANSVEWPSYRRHRSCSVTIGHFSPVRAGDLGTSCQPTRSTEYLARLKAFLQQASARGVRGGAACAAFSQGPISLRITLQVLPAAVSFLQNLSSGARSSSTMEMT